MSKEQIREIFLRNGFTIKEGQTDLKDYVYQAANELLAAQLEKVPEPAGFQIRNSYSKNEWTGCHGFATTQEAEECNSEWRYVFTSPPDVAELVKQNVELLHRVVNLQSLYESANKATEQAYVALAESGHKVTDLEKQVQALQAENKRLKNEVPEDPMDWRLPCSVTVGHGTIGKGCKLRTLVMRMQVLYEMAHEGKKS
jgi:hypothetical protein